MVGICGNEKDSDALVIVDLNNKGRNIEINSKLKDMFGEYMEKAILEILDEMSVKNIKVTLKDYGALDFVIKARTKTAIERALKGGDK
ncbi:citrate lyase acyl carrier protein [Fusobacterium sp. MFO224]|uniref:citrate lyase acyl carrier protein n=1 Tax=Fusobacterium sp. MFO224 TaxID=3378070 RepID=UPI0038523D31